MTPYVLSMHFGNFSGKHEINSESLIVFIEAYEEIAEFFGVKAEIDIGIPESGGWKTNLKIAGTFLFGTAGFVGLDNLSILFAGVESKVFFQDAHERLKKITEFITTKAQDTSELFPKECIKQKNKIYEQFQKDDCIDTFSLDGGAAIPRSLFNLYIKEINNEEFVYLGETNITVHSPDWKGKRSWKGQVEILEDKEVAFDFDKELTGKFWEKVKLDGLPLHTTDVMRVQLVKRPTSRVKYLVIRVLKYNDKDVDSLILEEDIRKIAVVDFQLKSNQELTQGELFDI